MTITFDSGDKKENRSRLVTALLFGFFGLLLLVGMFASAWWGSYVSCTDGGGHLHYTVPGIQYQCIGFYIQDDPRLRGISMIPLPNLTPNLSWENKLPGKLIDDTFNKTFKGLS